MRKLWAVITILAALAFTGEALAQHNQFDLVSTGPVSGTGDALTTYGFGVSEDGSRVFFTTNAALVAGDTDSSYDVYMREGGVTTLLSPGTSGPGQRDVVYANSSADGQHVVFYTSEPLLPSDGDLAGDIYEWSNGTLSLVSGRTTGAAGSANDGIGHPGLVSRDGSRVIFTSYDRLVAEDTDDGPDVYERAGGVTRLLSIGPAGGNATNGEANLVAASDDGSRVFFRTTETLTTNDPGHVWEDIYRREGDDLTLVTQGDYARFAGISRDGQRFFFTTRLPLVPEDNDWGTCANGAGCHDIYEYTPSGPVLISARSDGSGATGADVGWKGISVDGQRIYFETKKQLAPEDTDSQTDVYEHVGTTTTLVSTSASAGNAATAATFTGASADGTRIYFVTTEAMVPADTNGVPDVYERSGGVTNQISVGPSGSGATSASVSPDGARVLLLSPNRLVPEDTDNYPDLFERFGGKTYLLTDPFPGDPNLGYQPYRATPDLTHVFFSTPMSLLPADQDASYDLYEARVGPAVGYPRPKGATPIRVPLVPAFEPCTSPNRTHGPPLSFPSCSPVVQSSATLMVGTDDSNGNGTRSIGSVTLTVKPGNPATEVDDADVTVSLAITDVREATTLVDYAGELQGRTSIRLTDNGRAAPITNPPQTVQDLPFTFTAPCSTTVSTLIGSSCNVATTADTIVPGMVREDNRGLWQLGQIEVFDGGPDGDGDTPGNTVFARQGIFIP